MGLGQINLKIIKNKLKVVPDTNQGIKIMAKKWYIYNEIGSHLRKMKKKEVEINPGNEKDYEECLYFDEEEQAEAFIKWWESSLELIDKLKK